MRRNLNHDNVVRLFAADDDGSDVPAALRRAPKAMVPPTVASRPPKRSRAAKPARRITGHHVLHLISGAYHLCTLIGLAYGLAHFFHPVVAGGASLLVIGTGYALWSNVCGVVTHMAKRRALVLSACTVLGVYGGAEAWRLHLAPEGDETSLARDAHARFQAEIFAPVVDAEEKATAEVRTLTDQLERETLNRGGYGPIARDLDVKLSAAKMRAEPLTAKRAALAPFFTDAPTEPAALHANDEAAASIARVAPPPVSAYVEPRLLVLVNRLRAWDPAAWAGLIAALLIDLMGAVLASGLADRRR